MIRHLVSNPCLDACGTVDTGQLVDGAPIYRCPGCGSQWVEIADGSSEAPEQISDHLSPDTVKLEG